MSRKMFALLMVCLCMFAHMNVSSMRRQRRRPVEKIYNLLHKELQAGHYGIARRLIDHHRLDVNRKIESLRPLCHVLAPSFRREVDFGMVEYLLSEGASLEGLDILGRNALHKAIHRKDEGDRHLFDYILERASEAIVNGRDKAGRSPLFTFYVFSYLGEPEFAWSIEDYLYYVERLLEKGANANDTLVSDEPKRIEVVSYTNVLPLHMAILHGSFGLIEMLVERGADVNRAAVATPLRSGKLIDEDICSNYTPLDLVTRRPLELGDHERIVQLLLGNGAEVTRDTQERFEDVQDDVLKDNLKFLLYPPSHFEVEMETRPEPLVFEKVFESEVEEEEEGELKKACLVCFEPFGRGAGERLYLFPCGHDICRGCLRRIATEKEERSQCPRCRQRIEAVELAERARVRGAAPPLPPREDKPPLRRRQVARERARVRPEGSVIGTVMDPHPTRVGEFVVRTERFGIRRCRVVGDVPRERIGAGVRVYMIPSGINPNLGRIVRLVE